MGINGLLPALKPIAKQVHVSKYKGQKAAVDGYSWLHKGAYCCARELCEGSWTDKFVTYFLSRIQLLRSNGIEPVVVFDGGRLPIKGQEEQSRHRARKEAREKAAAHLAAGNIAAAVECYQRCVDITPAMAKQVIEELKVHGVAFIVAPYEADAQMAYLAKRGEVQLIITEDSDLLAYGCPRVLYKLDRTGSGEEVSTSDLPNCSSLPLSNFTSDQFLQLCVMAGCDFLAQLPGIGLKKAHGLLRKYRSFTKVLKMLRFNSTKVPPEYETRFQMALWAFRHCRVYCPTAKALQHLAPLPAGGLGAADVDVPAALKQLEQEQQQDLLDFLGPDLPQEIAQGIAEGRLDPNTHKPYDLAAIYAGCRKPPPHIAAQLNAASGAVPHILGYNQSQHGGASSHAAVSGGVRSGAAVGAESGGGRSGSCRVGLNKKHALQGQKKLSWAAAKGAPSGVADAKAAVAAAAAAGSTSARKRATLGIAKFFTAPGAQQQQPEAIAAAAVPAPAAAAAEKPTAPAAQQQQQHNMQNSIRQALHALRQQQQQRQQQEQAEKQHLLSQIREHEQQGTAAAAAAAAGQQADMPVAASTGEAFELPSAKRQRTNAEVCHQLTPSVELLGISSVAATAAGQAEACDTSLLLDQHQQQPWFQQAACSTDTMELVTPGQQHNAAGHLLGRMTAATALATAADLAELGLQLPGAADSMVQALQHHNAFLHSLADAPASAAVPAASISSDGFGPAAAAAPICSGQTSIGLGSLPGTSASDPASIADHQRGTATGASLGNSMNGTQGLVSSSLNASLDSSLGLPAGSGGGRGAAVSALTALFKGPQQQAVGRQQAARQFFEQSSSEAALCSDSDASQQGLRVSKDNMLGSCPSGGTLGPLGPAGAARFSESDNLLGSAGFSGQGLGSSGVSMGLEGLQNPLQQQRQQQPGTGWLSGSTSFLTPEFTEQQQQFGEEEEVVSPPKPHDLALGGSSSQPWKRLQQSLRGLGGVKPGPRKTFEPVQPGSSLQGLKAQLGLGRKRSRFSISVSSSSEDLLGDLGLGSSMSDGLGEGVGLERTQPAAAAGDSDDLFLQGSGGSDGLGGLGLAQVDVIQPQQQKRQKNTFFDQLEQLVTQRQQQQEEEQECITVPDSEEEEDKPCATAAAADPAAVEPAEGSQGAATGVSTETSSLATSNDENATPDIHSIAHIRKYVKLASKVMDKVQQHQQQTQQQQMSQQHPKRSPLRTSVAAGNTAAGAPSPVVERSHTDRSLGRSLGQAGKGSRARQRPGQQKSLAAELVGLRYDPSMFVPVQPLNDGDVGQQDNVNDGQNDASGSLDESDKVGRFSLGLGIHASHAGLKKQTAKVQGMFGKARGAAKNAAKPFKAPWLDKAAAAGVDGQQAAGVFGSFAFGRAHLQTEQH